MEQNPSREDSIQQRAGEHLSMRDKVLRRGFSRDKGRGATGSWRVEGGVWDYDVNEHQGDSSSCTLLALFPGPAPLC